MNKSADAKPGTAQARVCVVVGVGPGNGASLARRFHREGYSVALLARTTATSELLSRELAGSRVYACDVADAASVAKTFEAIRTEIGPVETVLYNAGSGTWGTIDDISAAQFEASWRVNTLGSFLVAKEVAGPMKRAGRGNIVFIGATASRRGNVKTVAFAPAKAAQRSLAESLARTLWPAGVHVALVIVDGVVDLARTRERMPDKPDSFFVSPNDLADTVFHLTEQKRSAWSFEIEARPFGETW